MLGKAFLMTIGSSLAFVSILTVLFSLAAHVRLPQPNGDIRYEDDYESRAEYTDSDKKRLIGYMTPPKTFWIVGAGMILVSPLLAWLLDALYRLIHSYSKYPMDKRLSLGIGIAVCAAVGLGMIVYYIYVRFYRLNAFMNKVGRTTELGVLISDFKNGRHMSSDTLVLGHRYIIPKGRGLAVRYSEIAALKRATASIRGIEATANLYIEKKTDGFAAHGGRVYIINEDTTAEREINELTDVIRMYAPDADIDI